MSSYPSTASGLGYVDAHHFTAPGDLTVFFIPRRAIMAQSPSGVVTGIYILSAVCSDNVTTVTTTGNDLPNDLTTVRLGQDPANAPSFEDEAMLAALIFG